VGWACLPHPKAGKRVEALLLLDNRLIILTRHDVDPLRVLKALLKQGKMGP
jgi:hypothetical protein